MPATFGYFSAGLAQWILKFVLAFHTPQKFFLLGWLLLNSIGGWAQNNSAGAIQRVENSQSPAGTSPLNEPGVNPAHIEPGDAFPENINSANRLGWPLLRHIADDQRQFWMAPSELRRSTALKSFLPSAGFTALSIAGDRSISNQVPEHWQHRSNNLSNYAAFTLAGGAASFYVFGRFAHNDHLRETGFLSGESALNSSLIAFALQRATMRQRPYEGGGKGPFFEHGSSFPSQHAALAWSVASVVAHEYPGPLTKLIAYGLASTVSVTRVTGKQHFSSDVVVGSALGWYLGRLVYRAHHDRELGGASGDLGENEKENERGDEKAEADREPRPAGKMGSTYVPLDSWVYPVIEKLAALGYVDVAFVGLKPWTRMECAQMIESAGDALVASEGAETDLIELQARLQEEFAYEFELLDGERRNRAIAIESVYARGASVIGPVLTDGYHFGQTFSDDFGRLLRRGTNLQIGGSFHAVIGPAAVYVMAEFQHAPAAPALSGQVRNFIATADGVPIPGANPFSSIHRPRLLDAYVVMNLREGWQLSFGKQSLSWGPGPGGSFLWSDNIEPIPMVRLTQSQTVLPGLLSVLGPVRVESFIGRLEGHTYIPHPYIYGNKINFKPLPSLELGFGRTVTIGGKGGDPFTAGNLFLSFFGQVSSKLKSVPGDSNTNFDWTFYVPKLRNYLVFYGELYADDDFVPFQNPPKNPFRPGIYLTRVPGLQRLDVHAEAAAADLYSKKLNYWNYTYRDGYTNEGSLIGNTVGRMGRSIQCWVNYWISARDTLQFAYKHSSVSREFVPQGGAWHDYSLRHEVQLRSGFYLRNQLHYEHISRYPILFPGPRNNVTALVEMGFMPHHSR
ncbi:MAG: capsule assembly Wzi family protein [Terriglobales bacterium]